MSRLEGKSVCITGELSRPMREWEIMLHTAGATLEESVTTGLDYLIVGEKPDGKLDIARKLSIPVLSEDEAMQRIGVQMKLFHDEPPRNEIQRMAQYHGHHERYFEYLQKWGFATNKFPRYFADKARDVGFGEEGSKERPWDYFFRALVYDHPGTIWYDWKFDIHTIVHLLNGKLPEAARLEVVGEEVFLDQKSLTRSATVRNSEREIECIYETPSNVFYYLNQFEPDGKVAIQWELRGDTYIFTLMEKKLATELARYDFIPLHLPHDDCKYCSGVERHP